MHTKRNQIPATGPLMRACRLCWDLTPVSDLRYGCCPECAIVLGEPARDTTGRFVNTRPLTLVTSAGAR